MTITSRTRLFAVIGDPVSHSLSPILHNGWIADHGLDAVYVALRIAAEGADAAFDVLKAMGFAGVNVTIPHKERAARVADDGVRDVANVLTWRADGVLQADNTDGDGFLDALTEAQPAWRENVRTALIVGAGGAAVSIAAALHGVGVRVRIVNRTHARAAALAARFAGAETAAWSDLGAAFAQADLIVNATSLGLDGAGGILWPFDGCAPGRIAVDIVYKPLETPFLRQARARGLIGVDGLGMLIHQAARAFEIWFGVRPDVGAGRARLLAALGA
ncbi:MAG: shikimate dehydrogenase [Hyphomonadaceae bacterium]|nr:shikimate dehydrogenase [Hyphomonadaceae bacterium]